jgi:hypothetical protein
VGTSTRLRRAASARSEHLGERLGGYIYGTIVVLSTIVAGAKVYENAPGHVAGLVFLTTLVFWLAHVYAHALARSVATGVRMSRASLAAVAHHESSIIEAAVLPAIVLMLGHWGVFTTQTAVWIAFACGLSVLVTQGVAYARVARLGAVGTMVIVTMNVGLGLALVGLKLVVGHH